ncbi:MAG: penicillin acylase family protein, partial [Chitinophagales bacterium]
DPLSWHMPDDDPEFIEGSNNWAVAGKKTKSGYPIFCSDPHLVLGLPNIWYETQLHVPDYNVYGVSIPGMPGIFIGFNDSIAWGETNASRDVRDWYKMSFRDKTQNEYRYDEKWLSTLKRIETIEVRDGTTIMDTVVYTHLGPIVYTDPKHPNYNQSMRWVAHDPSDDWLTFYKLNKAKNYADYVEALNHYDCPAQNFAFAAQDGDIAIWQQGRFPLLEENQGRFLQDGTKSSNEWQGYIPKAHNPHSYNPERGFISSTNQHPVDDTYPYYYTGRYEFYRNRRLNQQLAIKNNFVPEDMMRLQTDTYNLKAAETLPVILSYINVDTLEVDEKAVYALLKDWNYENNAGLVAPSAFEALWDSLYHYVWDEITQQEELALAYPHSSATALFISTNPEHPLMDIVATDSTETLKDVVLLAFQKATDALEVWQNEQEGAPEWQNFRHAKLNHLLRIPAFSVKHLDMGGNSAILNALGVHKDRTAGPSWRMIVAMGKDKPQAWGIYPGGQSGNPGSYFYENFVDKFTEGTYDELLFLSDAAEQSERILFTQNFSPR